jgi:adenylosuccinate lyase
MKLTSTQLRKIITEEIQKVIDEGSMTDDPELMLINNQLKGDLALAQRVLVSMVRRLPYMQAIEVIKMLSEKMPRKFDKTLQEL